MLCGLMYLRNRDDDQLRALISLSQHYQMLLQARSKVIHVLALFHHCSLSRDPSQTLAHFSSRLFFAHPPLSIHNSILWSLSISGLPFLRAYFAVVDSPAKFAHPTSVKQSTLVTGTRRRIFVLLS